MSLIRPAAANRGAALSQLIEQILRLLAPLMQRLIVFRARIQAGMANNMRARAEPGSGLTEEPKSK
jgi:hypothetical protein